MTNLRITRLHLELWVASDSSVTRKDLQKLLELSPCQVDDDVRFLYKEGLVTLSGPLDEREKVKARSFPKLETLQEKYKTRRERVDRDEEGEEELSPEDLVELSC